MAPLPISLDPAKRSSWESTLKEASAKSAMPVKAVTEPASEATPKAPVVSAPEPPPEPDSAPLPTEKTTSGETLPTVSSSTGTDDLPPLADGETHASTSYKVRLIAHHIGEQLDDHRISGSKTPLMVGLQGPQGCGKWRVIVRMTSSFDLKGKRRFANHW